MSDISLTFPDQQVNSSNLVRHRTCLFGDHECEDRHDSLGCYVGCTHIREYASQPYFIYRLYGVVPDAEELYPGTRMPMDRLVLFYIGITANVYQRLQQHKNDKHWFDKVAYFTWLTVSSEQEAREEESRAIKKEQPLFNVQGNIR